MITIPKFLRFRTEIKGQQAEDIVILIHRLGYENVGEFLTWEQINGHLEKHGVVRTAAINSFVSQIVSESFIDSTSGWIFKSEAYYRYLEYIEMLETKKNSKQAGRNAWIAIGISGILALIQIWVQVNTKN